MYGHIYANIHCYECIQTSLNVTSEHGSVQSSLVCQDSRFFQTSLHSFMPTFQLLTDMKELRDPEGGFVAKLHINDEATRKATSVVNRMGGIRAMMGGLMAPCVGLWLMM